MTSIFTFAVPAARIPKSPPEERGIARHRVRLMVASPDGIGHTSFRHLGRHLCAGDVVVVNTSATRPAAVDARIGDTSVVLHLAQALDDGTWLVELRRPDGQGPVLDAADGEVIVLPGGAKATLVSPMASGPAVEGVRLWNARLDHLGVSHGVAQVDPRRHTTGGDVEAYMRRFGRPITYGADAPRWPLERYQTVFARHPGSAEMASAGRPFSLRLVADLVSRGVTLAPITLHAGVSSQESGEPPMPERFSVPASTAALVTSARRRGKRIVAVGTTVTRALESAADERGRVHPARGWTDLVVTPDRGTRAVTGLVTGWHEANASHLLLLEAVAGRPLLDAAYDEALAGSYLWHEFGDSLLLLP